MEDEILLIDKPANMTSFGVVARVRRVFSETAGHKVKVGHAGTLDPFATGLLVLLIGKATKRSAEFLKLDKVYEAELKLGETSTTGDPEGEITEMFDSEPTPEQIPTTDAIATALKNFLGDIMQVPPAFSAIKVDGRRAYELARKGQTVAIPPRKVHIYELEILDYNFPTLKLLCPVSSGTYIRSLAEDLGAKLGTGAYLTALRRTKIGTYEIKDAKTLEEIGAKWYNPSHDNKRE